MLQKPGEEAVKLGVAIANVMIEWCIFTDYILKFL